MPVSADYIVVGAGLAGAVVARQLSDAGREALVLEKRNVFGGNCHDEVHAESGIRFNAHGPHYFRTSSEEIWKYVQRFATFRKFEAVVKSCVGGKIYDYPPTMAMDAMNTIRDPFPDHRNFEEAVLGKMSYITYEKFIKGYTEKQWGRPANEMDSSLANRVELRGGSDRRLSQKKYQGVPVNGYTEWITNMLKGMDVYTGVDYLEGRDEFKFRKNLIFTGAIDSYFNHIFGRLEYRSQSRMHTYFPECDWVLPTCQMNYPHPNVKIIREIEWKHIWPTQKIGTLITQETPTRGGDEYPVPDARNKALYARYRKEADSLENVTFVGRLAENRYYDMDEIIARALIIGRKLCES